MHRSKEGHPTQFLRILHYALFGYSSPVRDYIFESGVTRDVVHLNDLKFFKTITHTLVHQFGYKSKVTIDQFFKYGYAEMKMLLCCDVISLVKRKQKNLHMQRSLSAKRVLFSRSANDSGRFSTLAHSQGKLSNYYYERDVKNKETRVNSLTRDLITQAEGPKRVFQQKLAARK